MRALSSRKVVNDRTADPPVAATPFPGRRQDRFHDGTRDGSAAFPAQRAFHRRELLPPAPGLNPMPPRRELPLQGARDDPRAWPPSSAPLRLASQRRPSIARGSVAMTQAPVHPGTRTCLGLLWALAVTELLAALLRDLGLALRLLQQISIDARALLSVGQILARRRGLPFMRCHTRVRFRARHLSPLRRPSSAECCSEPRSSLRRSTARFWLATEPSPPNSRDPLPRDSGAAT